MNVTIQEQDGNMVAILEGSLDTAAAAETEKAMSPLYDVEGKNIIIDCTDLEYTPIWPLQSPPTNLT